MKFDIVDRSKRGQDTPVALTVAELKKEFSGAPIVTKESAGKAIALEGFLNDREVVADLTTALESITSKIQSTHKSVMKNANVSFAMEQAAVWAGLMSGNIEAYLAHTAPAVSAGRAMPNESIQVFGSESVAGAMSQRVVTLEAFDTKENKNAQNYSITYNLNAARQDEFGEAFFPTVVVTPDNVGFYVTVNLALVYDQVRRNQNGTLDKFSRKNVLKGVIDASILRNDQTRIVPVRRTGGSDNTVNFATGVTYTVNNDTVDVPSGALAVGKKFSLLGISQTDAMLAQGQLDETDALDSAVRLAAVYLKVTDGTTTNIIKFPTNNLPRSDFNAGVQGNSRQLQLNFETADFLLKSTTLGIDGAVATLLSPLATNEVRLTVSMYGSVTQDTSDCQLTAGPVSITKVTDSSGLVSNPSTGAIVTALSQASVIGYDLIAYRVNSNLRQRGQLLDTQAHTHLYSVPLLPPISAIRPVGANENNDAALLSALIQTTHIRCSNAAVTELLSTSATLKAFTGSADSITEAPILFGVGSHMVSPVNAEETLDILDKVNSIQTSDKINDVVSLIMNKIRDMGTNLYVNSGYKAAADAYFEGNAGKPVLIIGVDQRLLRYLTITGDTRLAGEYFDYKIVGTLDSRMTNTIFVTLGVESAMTSGAPCPLHFGNMAWKPEMTIMMPVQRNNANIMQLMVQPSFRHIVNMPILGKLTITNLSEAINGKTAVNMRTVA